MEYSNGVDFLANGISTLDSNSSTLQQGGKNLKSGAETLGSGLSKYTGGVATLAQGTATLNDNSESLKSGAKSLKDGSFKLSKGVKSYTDGVSSLEKGSGELTDNNEKLIGGAVQLSKGANKLKSNVPTLTTGISDLFTGSTELAKGTEKLANNSSLLTDGSKKLNDGALQISDGAGKLYDGSVTVGKGLGTLNTGVKTLKTGLKEGADTAKETTLSKDSKEMFASPVNAQETQITTVDNNGSAMAAYMMCAGLWVAALAFCILTGVEKDPMRIRKDRKRWVRKVSEVLIFAVGSGALLVGLLVAINGFNPAYLGRTVALSIMTSLAFTCIVYFFNILLGKIGSFLLLVILVIQLGCAGGTYPLDLSPQIYSSLNPLFPFSYAVDGFRRTIATGQDITHIMFVLGAFALVFAILSAITLTIKIKSKKEKEYSMSQLLEEAFD